MQMVNVFSVNISKSLTVSVSDYVFEETITAITQWLRLARNVTVTEWHDSFLFQRRVEIVVHKQQHIIFLTPSVFHNL
jgi:hypothetical protein